MLRVGRKYSWYSFLKRGDWENGRLGLRGHKSRSLNFLVHCMHTQLQGWIFPVYVTYFGCAYLFSLFIILFPLGTSHAHPLLSLPLRHTHTHPPTPVHWWKVTQSWYSQNVVILRTFCRQRKHKPCLFYFNIKQVLVWGLKNWQPVLALNNDWWADIYWWEPSGFSPN